MGFRKEILAFVFGVLLVLVTFGDNHLGSILGIPVGNLDAVFGQGFWPVFDVLYPLAIIGVFLVHGWSKGVKLRVKSASMFVFVLFIVLLGLMNLDDFIIGLDHLGLGLMFYPPLGYWVMISWLFPFYSIVAFFVFERMLKFNRNVAKT
jgi:hypothetical protein